MAKKRGNKNKLSGGAVSRGVSEEGFNFLLNNLREEVRDCNEVMSNYAALVDEVNAKYPGDTAITRIEHFKAQVSDANNVMNENLKNIEELFDRIFKDWQAFKEEKKNQEEQERQKKHEEKEKNKNVGDTNG